MTQYTNPKDINARLRMDQALQLRLAGASLESIAKTCGYGSRASVHKALKRAMAELPHENAEALRTMEARRLDELQAAWWIRAKKDVAALHAVLRIMEHRARLFGICLEPTEINKPQVLIREVPNYLKLLEPGEERQSG